ncbi:MAG: hypothetical protein AB1736_00635 [Chloroflexota bacterium]
MTIEPIRAPDSSSAEGMAAWRVLGDGATTFYATPSFAASAGLIDGIAGIAGVGEGVGDGVDVDLRSDGVTVRPITAKDRS